MAGAVGEEGRHELIQRLEGSVRRNGRFVDTAVRVQFALVVMPLVLLALKWSEMDRGEHTLAFVSFVVVHAVLTVSHTISGNRYRRALNKLTALRRLDESPGRARMP